MPNELKDTILSVIDKAISSGGLPMTAASIIQDIRRRAELLESELISTKKNLLECTSERDNLRRGAAEVSAKKATLDIEAKALVERETKCRAGEMANAVAVAKYEVLDKFMDKLLANRQLRESTWRNVPVFEPYSGGGGQHKTMPTSEGHETEER